ncbi:MAG: hypothetical protein HY812_01270, partial [Planctomycetes bacterium]|nr:hypothetical protein [Planctomycetota bacterium]
GHDLAMGDWNFKGIGIASNQGPGHYGELDNQHMGIIRNQLMAYGYKFADQIYDPTATKAMVFNGLNNGRRTLNYCGHGGPTGWGTTGFSNSDVALLNNQGMLPTNHTVACSCGDFSYGTCFGEAWLRSMQGGDAIGGIAAYMSSISQYWNEPMYGQACHLNGGKYAYVDYFCAETMDTIGALWFAGSCTMMDICGSAGRDMFMTWILFGDPSLCVIHQPLPDWAVKYGAGEVCSKGTVASIRHAGGFPSASNPGFAVALTGGNTGQFTVLFSGDTQASTIYPWGELLVGPPNFLRTYAMTDYMGRATVNIPISAAMVGTSKCFQFAVRDKGFGGDVQASDGLQITFLP